MHFLGQRDRGRGVEGSAERQVGVEAHRAEVMGMLRLRERLRGLAVVGKEHLESLLRAGGEVEAVVYANQVIYDCARRERVFDRRLALVRQAGAGDEHRPVGSSRGLGRGACIAQTADQEDVGSSMATKQWRTVGGCEDGGQALKLHQGELRR